MDRAPIPDAWLGPRGPGPRRGARLPGSEGPGVPGCARERGQAAAPPPAAGRGRRSRLRLRVDRRLVRRLPASDRSGTGRRLVRPDLRSGKGTHSRPARGVSHRGAPDPGVDRACVRRVRAATLEGLRGPRPRHRGARASAPRTARGARRPYLPDRTGRRGSLDVSDQPRPRGSGRRAHSLGLGEAARQRHRFQRPLDRGTPPSTFSPGSGRTATTSPDACWSGTADRGTRERCGGRGCTSAGRHSRRWSPRSKAIPARSKEATRSSRSGSRPGRWRLPPRRLVRFSTCDRGAISTPPPGRPCVRRCRRGACRSRGGSGWPGSRPCRRRRRGRRGGRAGGARR